MNKINLEPLVLEKVKIFLNNEEQTLSLILTGAVDMRNPTSDILPYLIKVHDEVVKNKIKRINVDIKDLIYMNSSGIKILINWIMKINDEPRENYYCINFISNSDIAWQESTLPVLHKLFPDNILINSI